jgi:DnaK suppressor protein
MPKTAPKPTTTSDEVALASTGDPSGASAKFFSQQRELLVSERETYVLQADALKAEAQALAEDMEPGDIQFDEESGEGGTMAVERERDLTLSAQARAAVDEIDRALRKIEIGSYGICEKCETPIPKARLKALPYAALCVACKSGGLSRR